MDENIIFLIKEMGNILIGKEDKIKKIVCNLLVGGNILLEDMPGVGKTIIAKSLSKLICKENNKNIKFSRIQGTPDLLPYDITGVDIFDTNLNDFVFKPGPIFAHIVLFDELNRTTPKVQSALLQAMAEKSVTIGRKTYNLPQIFFVIATQNPIESEGTYPLPQAQLDRFTSCLKIGYPDFDNEFKILKIGKSEYRLPKLKPIITIEKILEIRENLKNIEVDDKILIIISKILQRTRDNKDLRLGLSTRAGLAMVDMLKSYAYINGRDYVIDQDIIDICEEIWAHRIIPSNPQINQKDLISKITREEVRKMLRH